MPDPSQGYLAKPDYDHWCNMARWEWKDAAALSVGLEPRNLSDEIVDAKEFSPALRTKYRNRLHLVENHVQAGRIDHYSAPSEFLSWAKSNGVSYPKELEETVEASGGLIADWRLQCEKLVAENAALKLQIENLSNAKPVSLASECLRSGERSSLLKMVRGMAREKYAYDPSSKRSNAALQIKSDVEKQGLKIDEDTVRKWLKKAFELPKTEE